MFVYSFFLYVNYLLADSGLLAVLARSVNVCLRICMLFLCFARLLVLCFFCRVFS